MDNFFLFVSSLCNVVAGFLMTEPVVWFVGIFLLLAIVSVVKKIL